VSKISHYQKLDTDNLLPLSVTPHKKVGSTAGKTALWHEALEIKLFYVGGTELVIGAENYVSEPGDIFVINTCRLHSTVDKANNSDYHLFMLDLAKLTQPLHETDTARLRRIIDGTLTFHTRIRGNERLTALLEQAAALVPDDGIGNIGMAYAILAELLQHETEEQAEGAPYVSFVKYTRALEPAFAAMHEGFTKSINVGTLASLCGFSEKYFCTLFKRRTGMNTTDYVTELRLSKAKRLLTDTNLSIAEIAEQCGFADSGYFTRLFVKKNGTTPSAYRKRG